MTAVIKVIHHITADFFIIANNSRLYVQNINGGVIRE